MKFISLDVGEKRIGVAKADSSVRIAVPAGMVRVDGTENNVIIRYIKANDIDVVVVGMPRNLQGELTEQSEYVKKFVKNLNKLLTLERPNNKTVKIFMQDESLTSVQAKSNLKNRKNPVDKKSGEIDAEAAAIILQDFLENLARRLEKQGALPKSASETTKTANSSHDELNPDSMAGKSETTFKTPSEAPKTAEKTGQKTQFKPFSSDSTKKWAIIRVSIIFVILLSVAFFIARSWYRNSIASPVSLETCSGTSLSQNMQLCEAKEVKIPEGSSVKEIISILKQSGVIKNELAFRIYLKLNGSPSDLKAGTYKITPYTEIPEILKTLQIGTNDTIVFRFTALPGETLNDIKKRLLSIGYSATEIDEAFSKDYDHPVLIDKPADASLEGYLFGETYEFYTSDSVEKIVIRMLDELYSVVQKNNLKQKFNNLGLTLHEGIILASIVQKEAGTLSKTDMSEVAGVFINRLNNGMSLGSDVTVKYAVDLIDPDRETYKDNAAALEIDSCYNTRKNFGLPCGPISNPSALALIATANPSDNSYLYFLTGDDGIMYYSSTESEHNQNIHSHCQELCNTLL